MLFIQEMVLCCFIVINIWCKTQFIFVYYKSCSNFRAIHRGLLTSRIFHSRNKIWVISYSFQVEMNWILSSAPSNTRCAAGTFHCVNYGGYIVIWCQLMMSMLNVWLQGHILTSHHHHTLPLLPKIEFFHSKTFVANSTINSEFVVNAMTPSVQLIKLV